MLGGEISAVELVSGSWQQHSFSRIATSSLSSLIIALEAVACPLLGGGAYMGRTFDQSSLEVSKSCLLGSCIL
jgi:hypothetical protein